MNTKRQCQRFKALKRRELVRRGKASLKTTDFTLAASNHIKRQPLDVSGVEILEYEINLDH
jgi:hypothetical protein